MRVQCPCCGETYPIEAGFSDDEGKRLAALFANMEPKLGRAILSYLRLFSPAKRGLRTTRAIKLIEELTALIETEQVQRDARSSDTRRATIAMWVQGIEQMQTQRERLQLPLENHNYLRAVVWGIAGEPVALISPIKPVAGSNDPQKTKEIPAAVKRQEQMSRINGDLMLGLVSQEEAERRKQALMAS